MTVQDVYDEFVKLIADGLGDRPVHMWSDEEGNDVHALSLIGGDFGAHDEHSDPVAIVLIPDHASLLHGWGD